MSQENIAVVRAFFDAAARRDAAASAALDPAIEWIEPGVPALWFSGTFHGPDAVFAGVIGPTAQHVDDFRIRIDEFVAAGERVVALGHDGGRAKATGRAFELPAAYVCTVRGGRIVRFEAYVDTAQWLLALGLLAE
jgi:ketosteroid isomerase-like protein